MVSLERYRNGKCASKQNMACSIFPVAEVKYKRHSVIEGH